MSLLPFNPQYHTQLTVGEYDGAWVEKPFIKVGGRIPVSAMENTARVKERMRILAEGGEIVVLNPEVSTEKLTRRLSDLVDR